MTRLNTLTAGAVALLAICGCQHPMENPHFQVRNSGLNWVEVRKYEVGGEHPQRVRVRLDGHGAVRIHAGSSPLVTNPFAHNPAHPQWADITETRRTISSEEAHLLFQTLVDGGLFVKQGTLKEDEKKEGDFFFVSANISNKTTSSPEPVTDPDLIEHLRVFIMLFHQPAPRRAR